jgi:hypothetical protein
LPVRAQAATALYLPAAFKAVFVTENIDFSKIFLKIFTIKTIHTAKFLCYNRGNKNGAFSFHHSLSVGHI